MASSSRPTSVRGLYTPPAEEWVFLPPTVSPQNPSPPTPSHLPSPFSTEADPQEHTAMYAPLQIFFAEYFTTAIGMPFDVGKTLLQVEYRPRKRYDTQALDIPGIEEKDREWGAEDDTLSNPEEADVYFTDRMAASASAFVPAPEVAAPDASGYLPDQPSNWMLKDDPEVSRGNGVWGMIRRIRATPGEGLPALWKSQFITTVQGLLVSFLQPQVHSALLLLAPGTPDVPLTASPHPAIPLGLSVASHLLTHFVLSPIEIIKTRMIVMPSGTGTPSSVTMFRRLIDEEGGFASTYFNSNLFFPALLEHTLRPLVTLSIPLLLERQFGLSPEFAPITYSLADLGLNLASLVILLPVETVRKRLQLQSRATDVPKKMKTVVRIRDGDYVGIVEALWRIATEETGVRRKRSMSEKDEGGLFGGIRQLYRGFGLAAGAHTLVFGLGLVSTSLGGRGFDGGWKEI